MIDIYIKHIIYIYKYITVFIIICIQVSENRGMYP